MNVAAVDIGTNSVRLLITDGAGQELARHMEITRLGQGVDVSGSLRPDAIARTTAVLARYRTEIEHLGASRVRAAATSAARDATNSALFFDAAERALGHRPELLSGEEEALLSFRGATSGLGTLAPGPYLVIDIGGGSTEFVLGQDAPEQLISVNMGCVRMTERHFASDGGPRARLGDSSFAPAGPPSDPPSPAQIEACFADVRGVLREVRARIDVARARTVVGLAGTITALAALQQGLTTYDARRTHRSWLTRDQVEALFAQLSRADLAARRRVLAEPKRAEVIVGGAAVLLTVMRELDLGELLVSESDILDGLAGSLRGA